MKPKAGKLHSVLSTVFKHCLGCGGSAPELSAVYSKGQIGGTCPVCQTIIIVTAYDEGSPTPKSDIGAVSLSFPPER